MDTPSKRVRDYLHGRADVDFDVLHLGGPKCPLPYATVRQSGGDMEIAEVEVEVWGKTPDQAIASAEKVRRAMKYANIGGTIPGFKMRREAYVVPMDLDARAAVSLVYNLTVFQER